MGLPCVDLEYWRKGDPEAEFHFLIDSLCPWADPTELTGVPCQIDYDLWAREMEKKKRKKRKGAKDTETLCTAVPLGREGKKNWNGVPGDLSSGSEFLIWTEESR